MSDAVLAAIETRSATECLPLVGREAGAFLEWLVRQSRPALAIEIGALVGYATIRLARNLPDGGLVVAVEIAADLARQAERNVAAAGLTPRVRVLRGDAREILGDIPGPIGFVLLDAERSQFLHHLRRLEPRLMTGAVVVAARAGQGGRAFARYLDYVRTDARYESEQRVFGDDALEVSRFRLLSSS